MTSGLLFAYALTLVGPVAWIFRRTATFGRAPALGILAWHVLCLSVLMAVAFGAVAMIPPAHDSHDHHRHVMAVGTCVFAVILLVAIIGLLLRGFLAQFRHGRAERRRHLSALDLVGRPDHRLGAVVIDHESAVAYCVPGRPRHIVLTTGAVRALDDEQLAAVLAHEQAHLRGRHHLLLAAGRALRSAFPFVPAFRWAQDEVARLVELLADDVAARGGQRRALARALLALAERFDPTPVPVVALSIADSGAGRVQRLLEPAHPLTRSAAIALSSAFLALLGMPLLAVAPAFTVMEDALVHCPFA